MVSLLWVVLLIECVRYVVQRAVPYDGPGAALFLIEIWGRLKFYSIVTPKSLADD